METCLVVRFTNIENLGRRFAARVWWRRGIGERAYELRSGARFGDSGKAHVSRGVVIGFCCSLRGGGR